MCITLMPWRIKRDYMPAVPAYGVAHTHLSSSGSLTMARWNFASADELLAEALAFVQGQPGITIPELAAKMGIKQNYLYRVLPSLESENKVAKRGRGWHPKG